MTEKQKRMVKQAKEKYPGHENIEKQLAYIDGYRSCENDTFGIGVFFGFLIAAMIALCAAMVAIGDEKMTNSHANALLNSNEWKIATVKTITNDRDTVTTYKFVKVNEGDGVKD